jgi:hypothetical protein
MIERTLTERVEILEQKVEILEKLPERVTAVEVQIVQLREEMRDGFSALRTEMVTLNEKTETLMRVLHEDVSARIALIQEERRTPRKKR